MFKPPDPHPQFEQVYNPDILAEIARQFGPFRQHHADLPDLSGGQAPSGFKHSRWAEVVMVIPNAQGHIWVHAKTTFPPGLFRLMTGGLIPGEAPAEAMLREVKEETGFDAIIERCLAVITYRRFRWGEPQPFASYLFLTAPTNAQPSPLDPHESISAYQAVPPTQLRAMARQLQSVGGDFAEWGIFRAVAHEIAADCLLSG